MKKTTTQKKWTKLYNENWKLCHEIVEKRSGKKCMVCRKTEDLALDHCISRQCKSVFFITDLLNYLCVQCHTHKSYRKGQWLDKLVDVMTRKRIGNEQYEEYIIDSKQPLREWKTISYQERVNEWLKSELESYDDAT